MRNSPPPPPPHERDTPTLVEDLCVALRDVGVHDYELPRGERVLKAIINVKAIHGELRRRQVDLAARLQELSQQTRWQTEVLLADCLHFPEVMPHVREADGVRRTLRCGLCARAERPTDPGAFWFCDGCLRRMIHAIDTLEPLKGVVLFRTYNPDSRCEHADADTVLAFTGWDETIFGHCQQCLAAELERRAQPPEAPSIG